MKALRYTKRMIGFESTSNRSNRTVSRYLEMKLAKHGFVIEKLSYHDRRKVKKVCLVAKKGSGTGGLAYFGHSDCVPADQWFSKKHGPFEAAIARDRVYGRGSCDMKGSIACILAASQLIKAEDLEKPLYVVITADEEIGYHGARHVVAESKFYREMVEGGTKAIIGEPTSLEVVFSHKGTCLIRAVARGKAAHSSTSVGENANLRMIPFLVEAKKIYDETENDVRLAERSVQSTDLVDEHRDQRPEFRRQYHFAQIHLHHLPASNARNLGLADCRETAESCQSARHQDEGR